MSFHCRSSFMFRAPLSLLAPTCTMMQSPSAAASGEDESVRSCCESQQQACSDQ